MLDLETLSTVIKSLGFIDTKMHFEWTIIACRELVFCLVKIPRDTIMAYILLCFLLDEAVNPPITKTYINPATFYQRNRSAILYKIPKTIIFFNTKKQAIEVYDRMTKYLQQLYLTKYMEVSISSIMAVFHQNILLSAKKSILAEF